MSTIEPRPSLVACTVHFAPAIQGKQMESLSGALRREYPYVSAPQVPSGPLVYFSDPNRNWAVWLTPSAIGLETRSFHEFGELHDRFSAIMRFLQPGLYSRVGVRCVYQVPVDPRPLPPDQWHLNQVVQWRSHKGRSCFDLDVSVENVPSAQLDESLKEIFRASYPLGSSDRYRWSCTADSWAEPDTVSSLLWGIHPTAVAAFPELLPFEPEPSEVETVADERAELLARKYGGEELSGDDQERLASLTARLEKLLPAVSISELENLLEMAEEAEHIRQWARESRQSLGLV